MPIHVNHYENDLSCLKLISRKGYFFNLFFGNTKARVAEDFLRDFLSATGLFILIETRLFYFYYIFIKGIKVY